MDPITQEEKAEMREVLVRFYGPIASRWNITVGTYDVLGWMVTESARCTKAMNLVPRPWDLSSPMKWAQRQVRQAFLRYLGTPEGRHYVACMKMSAIKFRAVFDMAAHGI